MEQLIYTRSSAGLFLKSPGHDVVACSSGLNPPLVASPLAKTLSQKYCRFYTSNLVGAQGERLSYIKRIPQPDGTCVYVRLCPRQYMDGSGERKLTFLAHLLLATEDDEKFLSDDFTVINKLPFVTDYTDFGTTELKTIVWNDTGSAGNIASQGNELPIITAPCYSGSSSLTEPEAKIVAALWGAAQSGKRVFLLQNTFEEATETIKTLAGYLNWLPISVRKHIGFTTLMADGALEQGIGVYVVPPQYKINAARYGQVQSGYISEDFAFDAQDKRCYFPRDTDEDVEFLSKYLLENNGDYKTEYEKICDELLNHSPDFARTCVLLRLYGGTLRQRIESAQTLLTSDSSEGVAAKIFEKLGESINTQQPDDEECSKIAKLADLCPQKGKPLLEAILKKKEPQDQLEFVDKCRMHARLPNLKDWAEGQYWEILLASDDLVEDRYTPQIFAAMSPAALCQTLQGFANHDLLRHKVILAQAEVALENIYKAFSGAKTEQRLSFLTQCTTLAESYFLNKKAMKKVWDDFANKHKSAIKPKKVKGGNKNPQKAGAPAPQDGVNAATKGNDQSPDAETATDPKAKPQREKGKNYIALIIAGISFLMVFICVVIFIVKALNLDFGHSPDVPVYTWIESSTVAPESSTLKTTEPVEDTDDAIEPVDADEAADPVDSDDADPNDDISEEPSDEETESTTPETEAPTEGNQYL
jgi:hypothetical protein